MNITGSALKYNRVTFMILFVITVMGIGSYNQLSRNSMPPFTVRVASIVTSFPGASPERVESLITDKIELQAQELPELDYVKSESRTGLSIVTVALKDEVKAEDMQAVWDRLRRKLENLESQLPSGIHSGPTLKDEDVGNIYGISLGLINDGYEFYELEEYANDLRDQLILMDEVAKVAIGGTVEERITIEYNDAELAKLGLSSNKLKNLISATNIIIPAGEINLKNERIILEATGNFETVEDIRNMLIPTGKGQSVFLGDISTVTKDYVYPTKSLVTINGKQGMALYLLLAEGENIVSLGEKVDELIAEYNTTLPVGIDAVRMASQDKDVDNQVSNFVKNLVQSIVIVLVVMFMFLGFRTGIVVSSLIPVTIVMSILLMFIANVGLTKVSLAALIMALGMLVDNAIVMAESMMVKMEKGIKGFDAAVQSSKELMVPLLTSSLTTSSAFLSFYLAQSVMGEIMGQLFVVITITLLSSWIMALTIVPMLAVVLIKVKKQLPKAEPKPTFFDKLNKYYSKLISWAMHKPLAVLGGTAVIFILSLVGFTKVPFVFMPESERNLVTLDFNLPQGTKIETTQEHIALISNYIEDSLLVGETRTKGVSDWAAFIGEGPKSYDLGYFPGEAKSSYTHMLINTSSSKENQLVIDKLEQFCFENLPDAQTIIKRLGEAGGAEYPIEIRLSGESPDELFRLAALTKEKVRSIEGTKNVDDNWGPKIKKFIVKIDLAKLSQAGLTNQDIAVSANTSLAGFKVGEFRQEENTIPIIMRTEGSAEISFNELEGLSIFSQQSGQNVALAQVANIHTEWQYAKLLHRDLSRTISIKCQLEDGYTAQQVNKELNNWLKDESVNWKQGYSYTSGGDSENSSKAMKAVGAKLPLSFFIIILLLVLQFNSFRKTAIIMFTVPLGMIGVVAGLLMTGSNFSFTGFLGIISLAGIVINNAIVLIDRIKIELSEFNRNGYDAIIHAANERFRPILLTTFTTSFGMIPLWIGGGEMWEPMAIAIIFGLLFATLITLVFVPVLYKVLYKYKK